MVQKQLNFDLPAAEPLTARERIYNRLAAGDVVPECRDNRDQDDLFAAHSRVAHIAGDFGHVVTD